MQHKVFSECYMNCCVIPYFHHLVVKGGLEISVFKIDFYFIFSGYSCVKKAADFQVSEAFLTLQGFQASVSLCFIHSTHEEWER